jgi:hypothetical protein
MGPLLIFNLYTSYVAGLYSNLLGLATAIKQYFATGYLSRGSILMDLMTLSLAVDFAIIGAVVALSLRHLFAFRR